MGGERPRVVSPGQFQATRVTKSPEGESRMACEISLELFRGTSRRPWEVPRHPQCAGAMRSPEGDGIGAENVSLGTLRGENRHPRLVPWHLANPSAARSAEGERSGHGAVSLGVFRAAHVTEQPEGESPSAWEFSLG